MDECCSSGGRFPRRKKSCRYAVTPKKEERAQEHLGRKDLDVLWDQNVKVSACVCSRLWLLGVFGI